MKRTPRILAYALGAIAIAACSDGAGPDGAQVSLSFTTQSGGAVASGPAFRAADFTISDGQNDLVITAAEVVLREIELKRVEVSDCDDVLDDDACEEFETGPVLVDLPLDGGTAVMVTIPIDPGSYDELEFDLHKVSSDDPEDAAFRAAHPDMVDTSIRVQGTFNGEPFVFRTDLNVEQEFDLIPPLVIGDAAVTTNVTVRLDLSQWFRDLSGALVDPATGNKGGENESLITENIKQNIEAFEDRDRDGDDGDEG